jgi:hypothetical protein
MFNLRKILLGVIILATFVVLGCAMGETQRDHDHGAAPAANTKHHGMSH